MQITTEEDYITWKQQITTEQTTPLKDEKYWNSLYKYAHYIYADISFNSQLQVAEELNMIQPRLSSLTPLLKAIYLDRKTKTQS